MKKFYVIVSVIVLTLVVSGCTLSKKNTNTGSNTNEATNTSTTTTNQTPPVTQTPLLILAISPDSGKPEGGDAVTITGESFIAGAKVYFGSVEGTDVSVSTDKEIKVKTPKGQAGVVSVKVVNPDGKTALYQNSFTYK